jgi:hypothetical protein
MRESDFGDGGRFELVMRALPLAEEKGPGGASIVVEVFREKKTGRGYQIDRAHGRYREAKHVLEPYGPWRELER